MAELKTDLTIDCAVQAVTVEVEERSGEESRVYRVTVPRDSDIHFAIRTARDAVIDLIEMATKRAQLPDASPQER